LHLKKVYFVYEKYEKSKTTKGMNQTYLDVLLPNFVNSGEREDVMYF